MTHTPTPWKLHRLYDTCICGQDDSDGDDLVIGGLQSRHINTPSSEYSVPTQGQQRANAKFIVTAVNSYDQNQQTIADLAAALKNTLAWHRTLTSDQDDLAVRVQQQGLAALTKAGINP